MLKAIDLTKQYKSTNAESLTALDKLNLTVESGEIFCLLGQNGAGKTTTHHHQPVSGIFAAHLGAGLD